MRLPRLGARREHAERSLFLVIAGFAVSVAVTRWFLDATGYPKVGGGGLHVAHSGLLTFHVAQFEAMASVFGHLLLLLRLLDHDRRLAEPQGGLPAPAGAAAVPG